jgi:hypothetical protein
VRLRGAAWIPPRLQHRQIGTHGGAYDYGGAAPLAEERLEMKCDEA